MSGMTDVNDSKVRTYMFHPKPTCNMCGAPDSDAKTLGVRFNRSQGSNPRKLESGVGIMVRRCGNCGLIYANPQPVPQSIDDHYAVPPEEYWKNLNYDPAPDYFQDQIRSAKALLGFEPGMKSLDIGLGVAKAARAMRGAGFDVYGIEPSRPFLDKALELLDGTEDRFQHASIEDADFAPEMFDFITFGAVLEHIYDPAAALAKAMHWVRPGGIIHAEIPSSDHLISRLVNMLFRIRGTNFVTNISPMHTPFHMHEFTLDSFRENGKTLGYEIVESRIDVCSIYHIPKVLHGPLRAWMERTDTGMQLTVFLRKPA